MIKKNRPCPILPPFDYHDVFSFFQIKKKRGQCNNIGTLGVSKPTPGLRGETERSGCGEGGSVKLHRAQPQPSGAR